MIRSRPLAICTLLLGTILLTGAMAGRAPRAVAQPALSWTTHIGTFTQTPQPFEHSLYANVWAISLSGDSSVGTTCRPPCDGSMAFGFMPEDLARVIEVPGIGGSARGINDAGDVAGFYGPPGAFRGFLLQGGTYSALDFPHAKQTRLFGINNTGTIVGDYFTPERRAFVYTGGTFTSLELPDVFDACSIGAAAINSDGSIVGDYQIARPRLSCGGPIHSYIRHSDGTFTAFEATADASATVAHGINDRGDIVGHFTRSDGRLHGFLLPGN
ncbi:MAG TPA: hypothetical protein VHE78_00485, partial [Gemmatimonadaceae bacterium]|nr:hypothetical protein [Gemmatimonadaceae bacterium]